MSDIKPIRVLREGTKIVFADGIEREIFPLTIRRLRKFLKVAQNLEVENEDDMSDEAFDTMVEAAKIIFEKDFAELAADVDGLEDVLDMPSFNKMMTVAMGADPNV